VSFYRVSVLDPAGDIYTSQTVDSLADAARATLRYVYLAHDEPVPGLLDDDGELTVRVKGAGERELTEDEKAGMQALMAEFGADFLEPDDAGGRWDLPGPEPGA